MKRINIIAWNNGGGLSRDIEVLVDALSGGQFEVMLNGFPLAQGKVCNQRFVHRASNLRRLLLYKNQLKASSYDVNLFLEDIVPGFFQYARVNAFIPNPEWFRRSHHRHLKAIDVVLCKTQSAQKVFDAIGVPTRFVSFTSNDLLMATNGAQCQEGFLHLAGRSWQKGTKPLIDLWLQKPGWPLLTVVQNKTTYRQSRVKAIRAPNIKHILHRLDDSNLRELQNTHAVHLCPSEVEGFGHCIAEAMSCRALTLTTDASPMNELVTSDRGILVKYHTTQEQRSGTRYLVDPVDLEQKITRIIKMDEASVTLLREKARTWFENNDKFFRQQIVDTLEKL